MNDGDALIRLRAGARELALPASSIRGIVPATGLMPVPLTRPAVAGVIAREERAVPVYRLAEMPLEADGLATAGRPARRENDMRQIVIVEQEGALVGLLVESTESVRPGSGKPVAILDRVALLRAAGILDEGAKAREAAQAAEGDR